MLKSSNFYVRLATRDGFNTSVRHINRTLDLLDSCGAKENIADKINVLLADKAFEAEEVLSVVNMLLIDKWGYSSVSRNISSVITRAELVATVTAKWKAVDLVIGYHHPDLGFIVLNPKNPENAAIIAGFRKNELVVLYAGDRTKGTAIADKANAALVALTDIIEGKNTQIPASLISGSNVFSPLAKPAPKRVPQVRAKRAAPSAARSAAPGFEMPAQTAALPAQVSAPAPVQAAVPAVGQAKMSAMVSVVVSNELFHNGNVEAWKRIIRSYNAKYPNLQVFIYYEGEHIVDINTLFKWGKVKHGSCIQFSVAGENVQDLAKLSRYFRQGASPQFEAFLHGSPDTVMTLF